MSGNLENSRTRRDTRNPRDPALQTRFCGLTLDAGRFHYRPPAPTLAAAGQVPAASRQSKSNQFSSRQEGLNWAWSGAPLNPSVTIQRACNASMRLSIDLSVLVNMFIDRQALRRFEYPFCFFPRILVVIGLGLRYCTYASNISISRKVIPASGPSLVLHFVSWYVRVVHNPAQAVKPFSPCPSYFSLWVTWYTRT